MRKIGRLVREDLCLQDLVHLAPDPTAPVPSPLPTLVDIMSLLGRLDRFYARQQERERLRKWRDKMGEAWLDRPKEVYKWMKNEFQPPIGHAKGPTHRRANVQHAENGRTFARIMGQSYAQICGYP